MVWDARCGLVGGEIEMEGRAGGLGGVATPNPI